LTLSIQIEEMMIKIERLFYLAWRMIKETHLAGNWHRMPA